MKTRQPFQDPSRTAHHALAMLLRRALVASWLALTAGLVWLSLMPFDLTRTPTIVPGGDRYGLLYLNAANFLDILANLAIYVPFGALACLALRACFAHRWFCAPAAVIVAACVSLGIEHAQYFLASRVPSWADVMCNVTGSALGAAIVVPAESFLSAVHHRFAKSARKNWWLVLTNFTVCLTILIHLRPFDVVIDIPSAAARLTRADLHPAATWNQLPKQCADDVMARRRSGMFELPRMQVEYLLDRIAEFAGYAGLTLLIWLGAGLGRGHCPDGQNKSDGSSVAAQSPPRLHPMPIIRTVAGSALVVMSTAFLITLLRSFLSSHGIDTAHLVTACAGWLVACMIGLALSSRRQTAHSPAPITSVRGIAVAAALIAISLVAAYELAPLDFVWTGRAAGSVQRHANWLPFREHFFSNLNDAAFDISGDFLRYAAVAASVLYLLPAWIRRHRQLATWSTATITIAAACAAQCAHLFMPSQRADLTTVLLAGVAAFCVCTVRRWAIIYRDGVSSRYVNDLLTAQLIDGRSFEGARLTSPAKPRSDASPTRTSESARRD